MSQKNLHELLKQEQEPFKLKNFIADKHLQAKKRNPKKENSNFTCNICKNTCLFAYNNTQQLTKSPLFQFSSPAKTSNAIFIHVPARTAAVLLEAAMRIQKKNAKTKNAGFGMFGKLFERFKQKKGDEVKMSVKDVVIKNMKRKSEMSGWLSSAGWSESNEDKSFDTSSSGSHFGEFCNSPFHFVLQNNPSSGHRKKKLSSPVASPVAEKEQDKDVKNLTKFQGGEDDDERKQCSPVSVLDPHFQNDEHIRDRGDEDECFDMECSYEFVHKAKQRLLKKLCRFEKLAELDPVELEKRILEHEHGDYCDHDEIINDTEEKIDDSEELGNGNKISFEVLRRTSLFKQQKISKDIKRLVSDLVAEEVHDQTCFIDRELTVNSVCKKIELWNDVEFNTIDMTVEQDLKYKQVCWKSHQEEVGETASNVEVAIFGLLVEELAKELVYHRKA